jgi:probable rRNA maturation factor
MNENCTNLSFLIDVQVALDTPEPELPEQHVITSWLSHALAKFRKQAELSVRIVDNDEIQTLNNRYRNKNKPTNVLAFPADLPPGIILEYELLGDIVIASSVVKAEAKQQDKSYQAHFAHMLIHGALHLLGFDHHTEQEAAEMEQHEIDILKELEFANPYKY